MDDRTVAEVAGGPRQAALAGVAAPVLFALLIALGGFIAGNAHNHRTQAISELGATGASTYWLQNSNFWVTGVMLAGFSFVFARRPLVRILVLAAGLGFVASGFAPCSPGCPLPGRDAGATSGDVIHIAFGVVVFLTMALAPLAMAASIRSRPDLAGYRTYSWISGALGLIFFVFFVTASKKLGVKGLSEILMLGAPLLWCAVTGTLLSSGRAGAAVERSPGLSA